MADLSKEVKFNFFHGPDCRPFGLTSNDRVISKGYYPFHGIVSRGLLNKLRKEKSLAFTWYDNAAGLENVFREDGTAEGKALAQLGKWARDCKVLPFALSAKAALSYVKEYFIHHHQDCPIDECCLWNVKEGHTSSVWKVTYNKNQKKQSFALNISRDGEAARELFETSKAMLKIQQAYSGIKMAKVRELSEIPLEYFGESIKVAAVRNDWIDDAFEIHSRNDGPTNRNELILVERFIVNSESPAHIVSVLGRVFGKDETRMIKGQIRQFIDLASEVLSKKVEICINDGDVVWNGKEAIVIAIN